MKQGLPTTLLSRYVVAVLPRTSFLLPVEGITGPHPWIYRLFLIFQRSTSYPLSSQAQCMITNGPLMKIWQGHVILLSLLSCTIPTHRFWCTFLSGPQAWADVCAHYHSTLGWPLSHRLRTSVRFEIPANTGDFFSPAELCSSPLDPRWQSGLRESSSPPSHSCSSLFLLHSYSLLFLNLCCLCL